MNYSDLLDIWISDSSMVKGGDENEFEWEASKENVQLLKEGRNVGKLNKALIESKSRKALQVKKDRIQ